MPWKDQLPGGLADKMSPDDFDPEQVLKGLKVELEHTDDERLAVEITLDHLAEDPAYYDKLEKIDPHDAEEGEADVVEPEIKLSKPKRRVFIEGDDFFTEVGDVADALYARGSDQLGNDTLGWLKEALSLGSDAKRSD